MFHPFPHSVSHLSLPERFTYPFHYTPHPLCVIAAEEVQAYLREQAPWEKELREGKMFGVLVVRGEDDEIGYLAAFSGNLAGKNVHSYFVPPIYDLLQPDGFFRIEEDRITAMNSRIETLRRSSTYQMALQRLAEATRQVGQTLAEAKEQLKVAKVERERRRQDNPGAEELAALIRESQFQKAELKRLEHSLREKVAGIRHGVDAFESEIERLKLERKSRSAALQHKLFEQFRILNAKGEIKDLCELFAPTSQGTPPAGAGECAAPKLLQYAFLHRLAPIAMAEFWWGDSPKAEIRHHGHYYPACKGKCEPILRHMLEGLEVDENPLSRDSHTESSLEILFEDASLLAINKPAGMLSVPGKENVDSVYQQIRRLYPNATGPLIVHRLDMATSGVLLIAKTKEAHQELQAQFENRTVKKRYIAVLEGTIPFDEGSIALPLCPDPLDRPRQIVHERFGKPAVTVYKVIKRLPDRTIIAFYPQTGRTHQLRVHAAHSQGLHCPICGDELYGRKADRLYLHAEYLAFTHPISKQKVEIESKNPFL